MGFAASQDAHQSASRASQGHNRQNPAKLESRANIEILISWTGITNVDFERARHAHPQTAQTITSGERAWTSEK